MSEFLIMLGDILMIVGVILLVGLMVFWYLLKRFNDRLEAELASVLKQVEDRIIGLEVEVDNNQYFIYNASDKSFICQGATAEQILERFRARCPDKNAYFESGDERAIEYLTQEILRIKGEDSSSQ
jgi:hypothetical protein